MSTFAYFCRGCLMPGRPARWKGPCPCCGGLWTINQRHVSGDGNPGECTEIEEGEVVSLSDATEDVEEEKRIEIGGVFESVDEILGGGIVEGSLTLLSGPPGTGKSTFMLTMLHRLAKKCRVLYVIGEEAIKQVALRAKRMELKLDQKFRVIRESDLNNILLCVEDERPKVVIIDSAQTLAVVSETTDEALEPGSPTAIKSATRTISNFAQRYNVAFWLIGHVTRDGTTAGGRSGLDHAVDTILYFDIFHDAKTRVLRCAEKNRFGPTGPLVNAKFTMTKKGLIPFVEEETAEENPRKHALKLLKDEDDAD